MKGLKCKVFYGFALGLLLSCFLNFGLVKNTNAARDAFVPTLDRNISTINYTTRLNGTEGSGSSNAASNNVFNITLQPTNNLFSTDIQRFRLTKLTFNNTVSFSANTKYLLSLLIRIRTVGGDSFGGVVCPAAETWQTKNIILDCKVTAVGVSNNIDGWSLANSQYPQVTNANSEKEYLYQMDIYGTYNTDGLTLPYSTNQLGFGGEFITWKGDGNHTNGVIITIFNTRFATGYEYDEALEMMQNQQNQEQQQQQQIEDTQQDGADKGGSARQDAETQYTNIGGVIVSFVNAITNMHVTNCRIPDININGMVLEDLDFCQTPLPSQIGALFSLGMVFIIIPLAWHLVKRLVALWNEIVGGGK